MNTVEKKLSFVKMEGIGNDYIYFDCFKEKIEKPSELAVALSNRHFGIGGDGIVLICPSVVADAKMRMFNADGSEGKMCGNAIRCVAKYLYDHNLVKKNVITIETLSGIKTLKLFFKDRKTVKVTVNMGRAVTDAAEIPVELGVKEVINKKVKIADGEYAITCVSMGNPHCVVFVNDVSGIDIEKIGPKFENNKIFPERVNTEFVKVIDKNRIKMRVWERGSGETLACGTGACAAVAACVLNGFVNSSEDVVVELLGGELIINYTKERVLMTGPAREVFKGEFKI